MEWGGTGMSGVSGVESVGVAVWVVGALAWVNSGWVLVTTGRLWCVPLLRSIPLLLLSWGIPLRLDGIPLWLRSWSVPLVPLRLSWLLVPLLWSGLVWLSVPVVGWSLVVEGSVITDGEVWALAWVDASWVLGSALVLS